VIYFSIPRPFLSSRLTLPIRLAVIKIHPMTGQPRIPSFHAAFVGIIQHAAFAGQIQHAAQ
jgi:hypothetical protein